MPSKSGDNGWNEWGNHVLAEIERLAKDIRTLDKKVVQLGIDVGKLKIKSGIWGLAAGSLPVGLFLFARYVLK